MSNPADLPPMTVVRLEIDSYRRIRAAAVTPSPTGLILVRGRNGQGKSSVLGAMKDALGVERSDLPITEGEHNGRVLVDLGPIKVMERLTRDSGGKAKRALTIEASDGSPVKGPAGVLKELRGVFSDPVGFLDQPASEQVKIVLRALGLEDRLEALEAEAAVFYEQRRDAGRDVSRQQKAVAEIESEVAGLPPATLSGSIDDLTSSLRAGQANNERIRSINAERRGVEERGAEISKRIELLKQEIGKLEAERDSKRDRWAVLGKELEGLSEVDVEGITVELRAHQEASQHTARREVAASLRAELEGSEQVHDAAKAGLDAKRVEIAALLEQTAFPVPGMTYDAEAKTLAINGIPFSQASQAERLRASAAIAMAGDPKIRVLFASEGSLIDDEGRRVLAEMAEARGFQLWLEVVDSDREGSGLWIEDGEVFAEGEQ